VTAFERLDYDTAGDFLAALSPQHALWGPEPRDWCFRGQGRAEWKLSPSALRPGASLGYAPGAATAPAPTARAQLQAEYALLLDFMRAADSQGLPIPDDSQTFRTPEEWIARVAPAVELALTGRAYWPPSLFLSITALAQHHGVPTRLLDWSERSLIGAYFAASFGAQNSSPPDARVCVWALNFSYLARRWPDADARVLIVTAPKASNPNLLAQSGVFTVARIRNVDPDEAPATTPLDEVILDGHDPSWGGPVIRQLTLPGAACPELLRRLHDEGVDAAAMFPGLDGAVQALGERRLWDRAPGTAWRR